MSTLKLGSTGAEVTALQQRLKELGFDPGAQDGVFRDSTDAAVRAFQQSRGLPVDGTVGPRTAGALLRLPISGVTVETVSHMFPGAPVMNIVTHLPSVLTELVSSQLSDKPMVLMALATIRAETAAFAPISEGVSRFNTSGGSGSHPFDLYDRLASLGNQGPPDGERFRGRGFVQLTGRANYQRYGRAIGLGDQLLDNPDLANEAETAAKLLAAFLKGNETRIRSAIASGDMAAARKAVNGGSHGLDAFTDAYQTGERLIADTAAAEA